MTVELVNRSGALVPETQMHSLINYGIEYLELNPECEISLTFVDVTEMEELHIKWMDEPGPTDVLSFPMDMPEEKGEAVTLQSRLRTLATASNTRFTSLPHMACSISWVMTTQILTKRKSCSRCKRRL